MTTSWEATPLAAKNIAPITLIALLILSGCLPSSCRRTESTDLLPADSLSRRVAESVPADTMTLLWVASGSEDHQLEYPRTVRFGADGTVYVSDVERRSLFVFPQEGSAREIPIPRIAVPYLAGISGDTISIFSPASLTMYRLVGGELEDSTKIQDPQRTGSSLVYGAANDMVHYKRVGPEQEGVILTLTVEGRTIDSTSLSGPHWRHAGLLKMWGDTLVSLSGFRPVVDLFSTSVRAETAGDLATADSLSLVGFDSPMLARSHSFMLGDIHEAPLLSASASPIGNRLFVLNMRPGWLQVDVFGRDGRLHKRLVQSTREYRSAFFPQDIDVRRTGKGYEIAVVLSEPSPEIRVLQWQPDAAGTEDENGTPQDTTRSVDQIVLDRIMR